MSIGKYVRELILNESQLKNEEILARVHAKFPDAKTTYACIAWYKSDLRKKGLIEKKNAQSQESILNEIKILEARLEELKKKIVVQEEEPQEETQE